MKIRMRVFVTLVIVVCAGLMVPPGIAEGPEKDSEQQPENPMEMIKTNTEQVLAIFRDPDLEGEEHRTERRKKVRAAVKDVFDWSEISKSAIGRKWWDFSDGQKKEFTHLFRQMLENTYLKRIENNADAKVKYLGMDEDEGYWTVKIMAVARDGREVPIRYKLYTLDAKEREKKEAQYPWLIYDVVIEGVSLVSNYRSQFRDILLNNSIDELIEKVRKKVESKKG